MKHVYSSIFTVALFTLSAFNAYAQGPNDSGTYYQAADGKKGAELKTALCGIIYNRTERTYNDLWTDFRKTDKREDGKVKYGICILESVIIHLVQIKQAITLVKERIMEENIIVNTHSQRVGLVLLKQKYSLCILTCSIYIQLMVM